MPTSASHRKAVETIAYAYLGPVAPAVCDGAFADFDDLRLVLQEIEANLPPEEVERFRIEVARAIGAPGPA